MIIVILRREEDTISDGSILAWSSSQYYVKHDRKIIIWTGPVATSEFLISGSVLTVGRPECFCGGGEHQIRPDILWCSVLTNSKCWLLTLEI